MQEEAELKLSVRPEHAGRIGRLPIVRELTTGRARTEHLVGTYFDTPDLLLKRRDLSLRVRESDKRRIQTLKRMRPASVGAVFRRDEWERDIAGEKPDVDEIDDSEIRRLFAETGAARKLRPVFRTDVRRTVWNLEDDNAVVELALDVGEIRDVKGNRLPVCEAELELKSGDSRRLFDIALALNDKVDCIVGSQAKSDRGYVLYEDAATMPTKASPLELKRGMSVWEAFVAISRNCIAHLEANTQAACEGVDPEGIHQARVAIRRLRAAFKVFKPALTAERRAEFSRDLRWLQKQLGDARDLDVFLSEMLDPLRAHAPRDPLLTTFRQQVVEARKDAYAKARKALQSRRYGRVRLALEKWFTEPVDMAASPLLARSARTFAKRSIRKSHGKVLAAGKHLADLSDRDLHALRIRAKQARYCVEFFSSLFPGKGPARHAKALAQLQDCLGVLNDSVVANTLVKRIERRNGALDPRAKACIAGWFAARIHDERVALDRIWPKLPALEAYWR